MKHKDDHPKLKCVDCKYYKPNYAIIIAPIENIIAKGICLNKCWQSQPIIIDPQKDYCHYIERDDKK